MLVQAIYHLPYFFLLVKKCTYYKDEIFLNCSAQDYLTTKKEKFILPLACSLKGIEN